VSDAQRDRFEAIYRAHHGAVRRYLLRRAEPELAQDALSETFLVAWRRLDELPADPLPWLLGTARRTLANQRRSARRLAGLRERIAGARSVTAGGDLADELADAELVREALAGLAERDREALMLVAWEGLDAKRAARAAGCSRATFAVRLHRARQRLDRALFALEETLPEHRYDKLEVR
jgi:RNA polymerase sigma factor (sigma-70 family)